ncbi:TetR/AcrR family transcriptional regulator [Kutzneria sp. CA-103260]|uniref:TetR/AcrR family transcriptional regulator n=1 Tax=Kutzneria sp. CA-103260 TaxID=2802641 RepID=UPI001BF0C08F|nr:TetR/AcrR family transcriptional regulator [Kutzneria sp. CA-103260]QUQ72319.1 TetR family transcriptional regulator [Kutzneria sp. CA-103260]
MPLRKDAALNQDRIVATARELVNEGTPLQLNDIARRTGLGVGTVYRHFPTAEALLETVATPCLELLVAHGREALADRDPGYALKHFLLHVVEAQVSDPSLPVVMAAATDALEHTAELKRTLWSVGVELLDRAAESGAIRRDIGPGDLSPLMCGIAYAAQVHSGPDTDRVATARRYLTMLIEGLFPVTST